MIKLKPPYHHLVQKPYFCGPACLQMILLRRGKWVEQEEIGVKCGAKILANRKNSFARKIPVARNLRESGLKLPKFSEKKILNFLKKYKLKSKVYKISEIETAEKFISENLMHNNDIIANIWLKPIFGDKEGHYVLVSEFDEERKIITACDPWYTYPSFWKIKLGKLAACMDKKFDGRERGFVVVSRI